MDIYPVSAWSSSPRTGHCRLRVVAQFMTREGDEKAQDIADAYGVSRQGLYTWANEAALALEPDRPGPAPGWREGARLREEVGLLQAENERLRARVAELESQVSGMVEVDRRRRDRLELVCFSHNVPLRGTQEIIEVAWGETWRPGLDGLQRRMKGRGQVALDLLAEARGQAAQGLRCVMADDVYFHRVDVKVVAEPESMAMLNVGRWQGSSGLDWVVWLEEFTYLSLLVSDLGKDLVGAATQLGVPQSADSFHELRWFDRKLLAPLSRREERARRRYWTALDRATRPQGPGRRLSEAKVTEGQGEADNREAAFFVALEVVDRFRDIYKPVNPATGRLWTRAEVDAVLNEQISRLETIDHASSKRAIRHLRSHRERYAAWLVMFESIEICRRPGSAWSHRSVLNGLIRLWAIQRQNADPDAWVDYDTHKDRVRLVRELERRLSRECLNLDEVATSLRRELLFPKRSSSGVLHTGSPRSTAGSGCSRWSTAT